MSQQVSVAVQTGDSDNVVINRDSGDFKCFITGQILFDPVMTHCGQHIERSASTRLKRCPCCNEPNTQFNDASSFFKRTLQEVIKERNLYKDVYFDLEDFKQVVAENKLNTPIGERFLTLLQNAPSHLNNKELIRTETQKTHPIDLEIPEYTITETLGQSAIGILADTLTGRDLLRKKLKIESASGKYFFGNAEISAESLQIQVKNKSIREWLSMTTVLMQEEEQEARTAIDTEAQIDFLQLQTQFSRARLFVLQSAIDAVNSILQQVVCGNENAVKAALEAVKDNSAQLSALLSGTRTVKDYSNRTITGMTLLQAAAAAGDIEMCLMLKNYITPEKVTTQLAEIFPDGIETHEIKQQRNAFNFDTILAAIRAANTCDLNAALNKTNNGSALFRRLEEFRRQFTQLSKREKIFNPHHLLRAFEMYNTLWEQCDTNKKIDPDYKKRDLFWRQIIGYIQRYMPACYAQAFSQGLYYLVKVDQDDSWRPEALKRDLTVRRSGLDFFKCSYFSLACSRSGLGFDFAIFSPYAEMGVRFLPPCCVTLQKLLSIKNSELSELYAASSSAVARPVG